MRQTETVRNNRESETIARLQAALDDSRYAGLPDVTLIGPTGSAVPLTDRVLEALIRVVNILASGAEVLVQPKRTLLTTGEAAERLGMSRSYLLRLLESGQIPYTTVGSHRRIQLSDVVSYGRERDRRRREQLEKLIAESAGAGLYDKPEMDEVLTRQGEE
jgi:excisionase family DNA binding protein